MTLKKLFNFLYFKKNYRIDRYNAKKKYVNCLYNLQADRITGFADNRNFRGIFYFQCPALAKND